MSKCKEVILGLFKKGCIKISHIIATPSNLISSMELLNTTSIYLTSINGKIHDHTSKNNSTHTLTTLSFHK